MLLNVDPLNTIPLNAVGDGAASVIRLADTLSYTDATTMIQAIRLADTLDTTDSVPWLATRHLLINEQLAYADLIRFAQRMLLADTFDTTDAIDLEINRMMALASSLVLTDVVGSWRTAVTVLADALAFTDESDGHWLQIFQDTLSLTDLVQNQITSTLVDSLILTTTVSNSVSLVLVFDDSLAFTDDLSALRTALMSLSDSVILGGIVNVEDEVYDAWVLNTETLGAWKYSNYPFNSFAQFQGRYYGCTNDGIYEITGDSDSGDDIDMTVRTGLMDFGSTQLKRIPRAYLGFQADGDLLFKTVDTASGEKIEKWHRLSTKTANAPTSTRIKLGRGTRARYWQFVIENIDGADVKIDDLRLFPILLKRRV